MPLDAIVAMARSVRAIPNELLPQVTLEQRLLVEYLQELQAGQEPTGLPPGAGAPKGLGAGDAPPAINVPGGVGVTGPGPAAGNGATPGAAGAGGFVPPNVLQEIVKEITSVRSDGTPGLDPRILEQIVAAVRQAERNDELGPEFVGPWIPPTAGSNGHNGYH